MTNKPRRPNDAKPIGSVMADLMARKGYANVQSGNDHVELWSSVAGDFREQSRARKISNGVLEVVVISSTVLQEITFQKAQLLKSIADQNSDLRITDIRFRVGNIA